MTPTDPHPENDRIMAVIARETDDFVRRDLVGWSGCWVQDHRTRMVCQSASFGSKVLCGWDTLRDYMHSLFDADAVCRILEFERRNTSITVSGDLAHVTFDGVSHHDTGQIERTFETRVMKRDGQDWRILYASFLTQTPQAAEDSDIVVDDQGRIISSLRSALAALAGHSGLTVSHGQLRGRRPDGDKRLRDGLAIAAGQHGFFEFYRYSTVHGQTFRLPVVLGETDDGGISVCVLYVRNGRTVVETHQRADIERRLAVAKTIFGLSDGQMALCHRIVAGDSLTAAAQDMGITINTARTHLSRVFAKTGINSQTALVRTLLNVG
ncbi:LuxR family transcriptional regulator [Pseudooctadecabacter sp.]|uniref:LuxR family transcriptional regulator n=1 Tax=Pseudooctadecabacter sp. TaxID=1966338 RepID=UPI0035C79034